MPELEKNLEKARLKAWTAKVKNVRKMEADVAEPEKNISVTPRYLYRYKLGKIIMIVICIGIN